MNTDKQLFQIFAACPDWLFELAGLESPGKSEWRSFTVKALQRDTDGLIVPDDKSQPLTIVEFQFRRDPTIYTRTISEMVAVQESHGMRAVRGMIFFSEKQLDPRTSPWDRVVQSFVLRDLLTDFDKTHPAHPLAAVFQPLMIDQDDVLEEQAVTHFRSIQRSNLGLHRKKVLTSVFVDWLEQRFPQKGKREIEIMLLGELPELEETQSGKDLIRIGEERGEKRGEKRGADQQLDRIVLSVTKTKFGVMPMPLQARLLALPRKTKEQLLNFVVTCETFPKLKNWLDSHDN